MQKRFFLIAYLFFYTAASTQSLHFETYTPANGLLDTRVIRIFQDTRGLLYFMTWEGLSIYDGQRFKNITEYNGDALGLVNDMMQWKNDTCYVFTFQKGVFKLINNRLIKDTIASRMIEPNQVIRTNAGNQVVVSNTGLYKWDGRTVEPFFAGREQQLQNIESVAAQSDFLVAIADQGASLKLYRHQTGQTIDSISGKKFGSLKTDEKSNIFFSMNGKWVQLDNEALQAGRLKPVELYFQAHMPPGWVINQVYFTGGKVWLQDFRDVLVLLDPLTGQKEIYPMVTNQQTATTSIIQDKEGNFWITAFNKQVQKGYYTRMSQQYPATVASYKNLFNDETGETFISSPENMYQLRAGSHASSLIPGKQHTTTFRWQNSTWAFVTAWLIKSDKNETVDLRKAYNPDSSFFHSENISFDREGRLLITGRSLYVVDKDLTVSAVPLKHFSDNIITDTENSYWAFNRSGEIDVYTYNNHTIRHKQSYPSYAVGTRYVIHWNADTFCIGTRYKGIVWLKVTKEKTTEAGSKHTGSGLSNNFVTHLLKNGTNRLFATTGFGLDEITIHGADTTIENLAAANNLFQPFNKVVKNKEGEIYARSEDGRIWKIHNPLNTAVTFTPAAWLDEITMNGNALASYPAQFRYNQNNFRFTVAAPCLVNAHSLRFSFLLENEQNSWQQQSTENYFSISNLPPGKYALTVTVKYPGKIYPDKIIRHYFTIAPPVWKRWWFITIAALAFASICWAIARSYYHRKLAAQKASAEKQKAIEEERNRISRDMHDDLGSGLTKIAVLSEVAKKHLPDSQKTKEQLEKISDSSRELVDNLQDIIWVLNPKNDTLENLSSYIREYTLRYFEPLGTSLHFDYPEQPVIQHISKEKRRNLFLVVKESLANIAKHAFANNVTIQIKEQENSFVLIIKDDGKGFDPEKIRPFANGLKNMRNRIEQTGGTYKIQSAYGSGTETTITMPV